MTAEWRRRYAVALALRRIAEAERRAPPPPIDIVDEALLADLDRIVARCLDDLGLLGPREM